MTHVLHPLPLSGVVCVLSYHVICLFIYTQQTVVIFSIYTTCLECITEVQKLTKVHSSLLFVSFPINNAQNNEYVKYDLQFSASMVLALAMVSSCQAFWWGTGATREA